MATGRPRQFSNAAEKQKAYRDKKKQEDQRVKIALALLEDAERFKVTLLKTVNYHLNRGDKVYVEYHNGIVYECAYLYAGGKFRDQILAPFFHHLVREGTLVPDGENWRGKRYSFNLTAVKTAV